MDHAIRAFIGKNELKAGNDIGQEERDKMVVLARDAYFGIKRVYQLSFFRKIWDTKVKNWDRVWKEKPKKEKRGGLIWMGTDCLRVSNLSQAEIFLTQASGRYEDDYRPFCALGFLCVEKGDFLMARQFFLKALDRAETTPQKIYVNLLMCRLYDIGSYPSEASEKVRDILKLEKNCLEILYQDVILKFKAGDKSEALSRLKNLIVKDRQFFVHALIDPELAPFGKLIHPLLVDMFERVKVESHETIQKAKIEYEKAKMLLGERETEEADVYWSKIKEVVAYDGFFAHLDVVAHGKSLIGASRKIVQVRKKNLFEKLQRLKERVDRCSKFIRTYRYHGLTGSSQRSLLFVDKAISETKKMANSDNPKKFVKSFKRPPRLGEDLSRIESKLKILDLFQLTALFFTTFGKSWIIMQSAVAILAIVLFPVAAHYLNIMLPKHGFSPIENVWGYQQAILIIGGVIAVGFAVYRATKAVKKGDRILTKKQGISDDPVFSI